MELFFSAVISSAKIEGFSAIISTILEVNGPTKSTCAEDAEGLCLH